MIETCIGKDVRILDWDYMPRSRARQLVLLQRAAKLRSDIVQGLIMQTNVSAGFQDVIKTIDYILISNFNRFSNK